MSDPDPRPLASKPPTFTAMLFGFPRLTKRDRRPNTLLSPLRLPLSPPSVMGKLKKSKASPAASSPTPTPQDEAILDDLLAQLDADAQGRNKPPAGKPPSSATPSTSSSDKKITMNSAMSTAKARFKAREVGPTIIPPPMLGTGSGGGHIYILTHTGDPFLQARKIQKMQSSYTETDAANDARFEQEARGEERDISRICDQLGLEMIEVRNSTYRTRSTPTQSIDASLVPPRMEIQIAPDGHCLFAAVADQLSLHGIIPRSAASYAATRATAAHYMMQHPDNFLPFLPSIDGEDGAGATESEGMMSQREFQMYCASIRDTAAWGGEPEIMALSRAYNVPIHVVQAGKPPVVIHEPLPNMSDDINIKIVFISYHRRMYGLGEVSRHPLVWSSNTHSTMQRFAALQLATTEIKTAQHDTFCTSINGTLATCTIET